MIDFSPAVGAFLAQHRAVIPTGFGISRRDLAEAANAPLSSGLQAALDATGHIYVDTCARCLNRFSTNDRTEILCEECRGG